MSTASYHQALYTGTGVSSMFSRNPPTYGNSATASPAASPSAINLGGNFGVNVGSSGTTVGLLLALVGGFVLLYATTLKIQGTR